MCHNKDPKFQVEKILSACVIATSYGYIDYSLALLARRDTRSILGDGLSDNLCAIIGKYSKCFGWHGRGADRLEIIGHLFFWAFHSSYKGFAIVGERFGSRKQFGIFK